MYRLSHEFTFTIKQDEQTYNFVGHLRLESRSLPEIGTLISTKEVEKFNTFLNSGLSIPQYWTLEIMAEYLYSQSSTILPNLSAVSIFIESNPAAIGEYSADSVQDIDLIGVVQ